MTESLVDCASHWDWFLAGVAVTYAFELALCALKWGRE